MCVEGRAREREKRVLLYIGDDGGAKRGEKENGCFILYHALIFKQ
jgi:hypothetical protein